MSEFIEQYKVALQDRHRRRFTQILIRLKSPSPFEKQMSTIYTHETYKKFQVEVLGVLTCFPMKKKKIEDGIFKTFKV